MMGSVSRPNRARATCPSAVIGQRMLWIGALLGSHQGWAFASSEQADAFPLARMHAR
jgi:hypothetical protein